MYWKWIFDHEKNKGSNELIWCDFVNLNLHLCPVVCTNISKCESTKYTKYILTQRPGQSPWWFQDQSKLLRYLVNKMSKKWKALRMEGAVWKLTKHLGEFFNSHLKQTLFSAQFEFFLCVSQFYFPPNVEWLFSIPCNPLG